ncbi:hypothetical protein [Parasphingorhabdus sp.]|uniref:hypothetical protein n=1 Tax=Parasphingorhabdus sp. TaxID=2709688 RepID=UPI003D2D2BD6
MRWFEYFRKHSRTIVVLLLSAWVVFLMLLTLLASVVDDPEPPVYLPDQPRSDENGCTLIDGVEICPLRTEPDIIIPDSLTPSSKALSADTGAERFYKRSPSSKNRGEVRGKASPEAIKSIRLVSRVLQVKKPIDLYSATFTNGPAAYARNLGAKSEIVYDKALYARLMRSDRISYTIIGLWGHEVGHVKYNANHLLDDRWENEASAEFFAGVAIYRLAGDFSSALEYTTKLAGEDDMHPPHVLGTLLTHEGWRQAKARHEDPSNKCQSGLIGDDFRYRDRTCKAAISCKNENRPVKIACQKPGGNWSWL